MYTTLSVCTRASVPSVALTMAAALLFYVSPARPAVWGVGPIGAGTRGGGGEGGHW